MDESKDVITFTYKVAGDDISYSDTDGAWYDGKIDGKDYPMKGDPNITTVSVRRLADGSVRGNLQEGRHRSDRHSHDSVGERKNAHNRIQGQRVDDDGNCNEAIRRPSLG